jgi:putative transposase
LTIPHRGTTSDSTYFVTANVLQKKSLFQVEKIANFFVEVLLGYRKQGKYHLHEFVVMPDHFHLIISPLEITLERSMQFIKDGFSFRFKRYPYSSASSLFELDPVPQRLKPIDSSAWPQA